MDEGIVTGEGVLLDARPASFASRVLGAVLDLLLLAVVGLVAIIVLTTADWSPSQEVARILGILVTATVMVIAPTTVDTLTRGRSLGKRIAGIRIVRDDGGPIVFRQAFVRALVGVVELWATFGSVALISSIVHPQGKRLGDMLAGTYAVRVRGKAPVRPLVPMPYALLGWAQHADIARLPDGLALAVRQFVVRAAGLHPASRVELGTQLTAQVQRYVRPLPPPGTHPEAFLAAVLAERRVRELRSGHRAAAREAEEAVLLHRLPHGVPDPVD